MHTAVQTGNEYSSLPTIDEFVQAMQTIRSELAEAGIEPTPAAMQPALKRYADLRREAYLSSATNSFDRDRRVRDWDRAQISGLFGRA
jgi:hypothetical protein